MTSALVLFCATLGVGLVSRIDLISALCMVLARGAVISALVSIFILPSVLAVSEPLIRKTTLFWRKKPVKRSKEPVEAK